ncbi:MAG: fibronectin type III domain-containing protein [Bifidobacteriaceae bacterium]|jgi:hypothetical protein|nr:fibronectin type III domain-containing protein [Bifidobacteriaceae bacterium]
MAWRLQQRDAVVDREWVEINSLTGEHGWKDVTVPYITYGVRNVRTAPHLPDNLRTAAVTDSSVTLLWDPPEGVLEDARYYQVYVNSGSGWSTKPSWRVPRGRYSTGIAGLRPNTVYEFALRAENDRALSPYDYSVLSDSAEIKTRYVSNLLPVVRVVDAEVAAPIGGVAEFEVTVTPVAQKDANLTYRWEKWDGLGWNLVTAGASTRMSISRVVLGDFGDDPSDGGRYRCVVTEHFDGKELVAYSQEMRLVQGKRVPTVSAEAFLYDGSTVGNQRQSFVLKAKVTNAMANKPATGPLDFYVIPASQATQLRWDGSEGSPAEEFATSTLSARRMLMVNSIAMRRWSARHWVLAEDRQELELETLAPADYQFWACFRGDSGYSEACSPSSQFTVYDESLDTPLAVHTVNASTEGQGAVSPAGDARVTDATAAVFTAEAKPGHVFTGFTVDGVTAPSGQVEEVTRIRNGSPVILHRVTLDAVGADHAVVARFSPVIDDSTQEAVYDAEPHSFTPVPGPGLSFPTGQAFDVGYSRDGVEVTAPTAPGFYDVHITSLPGSPQKISTLLPSAFWITRTTPPAPAAPSAVVSGNDLAVGWRPPAHNGGSGIVGYTVTATSDDGSTVTMATQGEETQTTFQDMEPGNYTVTVRATTSIGDSEDSEPSDGQPLGPKTLRRLELTAAKDALAKGAPVVVRIEGFNQYGESMGDVTSDCVITATEHPVFVDGKSTASRSVFTVQAAYEVPGTGGLKTVRSEPVDIDIFDPEHLVALITGQAKVGAALTAQALVDWPIAYQWTRDGAAIQGATAATYRLAPLDAGRKVGVTLRTDYKDLDLTRDASPVQVVRMAAAPLRLGIANPVVAAGQRAMVTVAVQAGGLSLAGGTVTVAAGGQTARAAVSGTSATVALPAAAVGKHTVTAAYSGSTALLPATATAANGLTVVKAVPALAAKVGKVLQMLPAAKAKAKAKKVSVKAGQRRALLVGIAADGVARPTGSIKVALVKGSKTVKTLKTALTAADKGVAKLKLPKLKRGKHKLIVTYGGNKTIAKRKATLLVVAAK